MALAGGVGHKGLEPRFRQVGRAWRLRAEQWAAEFEHARQFPISLIVFSLINLGVFSKYSTYFFQNPGQILVAVALAYVLSVIYYLTGFILTPGRSRGEKLAAGVSMAAMNNVLVIVFSSRFFGPLSPTLAAMYMFPFFTMIVPIKLIAQYMMPVGRSHTR